MCYFNEGSIKNFAFMFSCPGQCEEISGKPVSGRTGENLDILLEFLVKDEVLKNHFTSKYRYDYRIVNASKETNFSKKNGRSEAKNSDIKCLTNINRLREELKDFSIIILFGKKATFAFNLLNLENNPASIVACHLSLQALNSKYTIKSDIPKKERTKERIECIAKEITPKLKEFINIQIRTNPNLFNK